MSNPGLDVLPPKNGPFSFIGRFGGLFVFVGMEHDDRSEVFAEFRPASVDSEANSVNLSLHAIVHIGNSY